MQLHSQRRHVEAPAVALGVHALQEHGPGPADQVDQSVLRGGESESNGQTDTKHTPFPEVPAPASSSAFEHVIPVKATFRPIKGIRN